MLQSLSGKHEVITFINKTKIPKNSSDVTSVYFQLKISDEEINYYIKKITNLDKAGVWNSRMIGFNAIDKIEGSYFNVAGCPFINCIMN
jgi:septum formation protein